MPEPMLRISLLGVETIDSLPDYDVGGSEELVGPSAALFVGVEVNGPGGGKVRLSALLWS